MKAAQTEGMEANMTTTKKVEKPSHSASGPEIMLVGTSTRFISAVANA